MKVESNFEEFNPEHFRKVSENMWKRDKHPVDFTLFYLSHCKRHPMDVLFDAINKAASEGNHYCSFHRSLIKDNLKGDLVKNTRTYLVETGHLWWKKTETRTEEAEDHTLEDVVVDNIMSELSRVLWNHGFNFNDVTSARGKGTYIVSFNITW